MASPLVLAALLTLLGGAIDSAQEQEPATVEDVRGALATGEIGRAYFLAEALSNRTERAEWLSYLANAGGDVELSLALASEQLAREPCHAALLVRASVCAITLGRAHEARELAAQMRACAGALSADDSALASLQAAALRAEEFAAAAELQARQANRARRRAQALCISVLATWMCAMVWLSTALARTR